MKKHTCLVCQSVRVETAFVAQGVTYWRCRKCSHVFSYSVLEQPYEDYKHSEKYEKWKAYLQNVFARRTRDIGSVKKKGRVLEVGCSLGFFLDELKKAGFLAEGLEPSPDGVRIARRRGHTVHRGYLEKNHLSAASFDIVILNHVLEHIKDLPLACRSIHKLLKKNGIVFIESPNFGSLEATVMGKHWRYLYPQEHYSQFSPLSLATLLSLHGFEVLQTRTYATPYDFDSFARELKRCLVERDWKRVVVYLAELPLSTLEMILGMGTAVQCIARKKSK